MKLIAKNQYPSIDEAIKIIQIPNDADPRMVDVSGAEVIELNFPKFTDGRAFSQAYLLRRRMGYTGRLRAVGDVLLDQLVQMQRCGFSEAVLAEGQDLAHGERLLQHFSGFYQGDAVQPLPVFHPERTSANTNTNTQGSASAWSPLDPKSSEGGEVTPLSFAPPPATQRDNRPSAHFAQKLQATQALLQQALLEHTDAQGTVRITQASSLGAEDVVLTHLIQQLQLPISAFVLETGALHAETLQLLQRTPERAQTLTAQGQQAVVRVFRPNAQAVQAFVEREGKDAMYKSIALRKACCDLRKMQPLAQALEGHTAWITGLRQEQSAARAEVPAIDRSEVTPPTQQGRVKYNPLFDWTWGDVWHYIATHQVDYNPLHDRFYPSIGCEPCTRSVTVGEDPRSGRWWWEQDSARECGLHAR